MTVKDATDNRYGWLERLDPQKRLLRGRAYIHVKRILDLLIAVCTVPLWLPLLSVCMLLIKVNAPCEPVFFVQPRIGRGGRRFRMYKLRTMVSNAEQLKTQLASLNEDGELARPLKLSNDPRTTRVGRFLRKTSLDELPQAFNVLKGDMSWSGPRPTSFGLRSYELWHTERLDVLPGVTGLWQLYGRGSTDFDSWVRWDICYMEKRCLWLDMQILVRTVLGVLRQQGAQ